MHRPHSFHIRIARDEIRHARRIERCEIEQAANALCLEAESNDVFEIASHLGLSVKIDRLPATADAVALPFGGIILRRGLSESRQAHALAHEIGHLVFSGREHRHGDIWVWTFALAASAAVLDWLAEPENDNTRLDAETLAMLSITEG